MEPKFEDIIFDYDSADRHFYGSPLISEKLLKAMKGALLLILICGFSYALIRFFQV